MKKLIIKTYFILLILIPFTASAFNTKAKYAALLDYDTGEVLYQKNADEKMVPSSMTKVMTAYIVFERLKSGILNLDDEFTVSEKAWKKGGSKMFLRHTERVTVEELLNGIIVQSGNDACITVAEGISSSEESFAELMNETAKRIGLTNSNFVNSTGWPDDGHYMSAKDLAVLARRIIKDFPEYYHYFAKAEYKYSNIKQANRNSLLFRDIGVDGLKTGHTDDGGYGIVISGEKDGRRVLAVVNGLDSEFNRTDEAERLLNYGFRNFTKKTLFKKGQVVDNAQVWQGKTDEVSLSVQNDIELLIPKLSSNDIQVGIEYEGPVASPIKKGDKIGSLFIQIPNMERKRYPLVASDDVKQAGSFNRFITNIKTLLESQS
ncbi:MAG: D-alanyl-D-alanine carboxypeptidase [Alphaproteobacteria bacterium CG11_big_fil_rev_8_21_14_0_20_39_49]|nr:MAG: D-alanyl-D-alanine carboxypeptidase [Alphaproteobacteria bacterium CG11_big_fil_rev_8_21_14_0_20_39_49]